MTASILAALLLSQAAGPVQLAAVPGASALRFRVVHPLHEVNGESRSVEARAVIRADGQVVAMARAPLSTFRSGDANRDAHMLEALGAASHPFVVFKGVARLPPGHDLGAPGSLTVAMQGELELRGARRRVEVPLTIEPQAGGRLLVRGRFDVSLEGHGVERPSLLLVKIDDTCRIDLELLVAVERAAPEAP
jgi:YceI-like protein